MSSSRSDSASSDDLGPASTISQVWCHELADGHDDRGGAACEGTHDVPRRSAITPLGERVSPLDPMAAVRGESRHGLAGDALQDRLGLGRDEGAVPPDEDHVHAAQLLEVPAGIEEQDLLASVLVRLGLG